MTTPYDSILLIAFGGPPRAEDAYEYVKRIVGNRPGSEARIREVAHHYEVLGGSPFNRLTFEQADALKAELARRGVTLPMKIGFRNWTPFVAEAVADMKATGLKKAVGVVLAPHSCYVADEKYKRNVDDALRETGADIAVDYTDNFAKHYQYVKACADLIRVRIAEMGPERWGKAKLIFSAHSVPVNGCEECQKKTRTCPYPCHYEQSARFVAEDVGRAGDFLLAYQSRASMRTPWLEPDISDAVKAAAAGGAKEVLIAPIGFLCDHVEVLYDLDHEAKETCAEVGVGYHRSSTVQSHPRFISMLADLIEGRLRTQMPV
jgi:ferrochelatase